MTVRPVIDRGGSAALYDSLASDYDAHFDVPHRRAYDDLAWQLLMDALPPAPTPTPTRIIDVGCGTGRWSARLRDLGHDVIGIESAPAMARMARKRAGSNVRIIESAMESADLPPASADVVIAIGSLQYSEDPHTMLRRFAQWVRPGGHVIVLVDSFVALVRELFADGRGGQAMEIIRTRRGCWTQNGHAAHLHLLDAADLRHGLTQAGLDTIEIRGLLIGWSLLGKDEFLQRLTTDPLRRLEEERLLSAELSLADLGKQLYAHAQVPPVSA